MDIKEHGMLYKAEMVRKLLAPVDPKTQTRRPVTFANSLTGGAVKRKEWHLLDWDNAVLHNMATFVYSDGLSKQVKYPQWHVPFKGGIVEVRPRVMPNDLIWVREHWGYHGDTAYGHGGQHKSVKYHADGSMRNVEFETFDAMCEVGPHQNLKYPDGFNDLSIYEQASIESNLLSAWWKRVKSIPAIHLPRWASRIDLNVTGMRSQRIQEISGHDAKAEGIVVLHSRHRTPTPVEHCPERYVNAFYVLWDSINTERGFPWAGNHPVWIHEFKRAVTS